MTAKRQNINDRIIDLARQHLPGIVRTGTPDEIRKALHRWITFDVKRDVPDSFQMRVIK